MLPSAQLALTQALTVLGDADAAIAQLDASLREPSGTTIALLRLDPLWDPLRKNPRFQALLEQQDWLARRSRRRKGAAGRPRARSIL